MTFAKRWRSRRREKNLKLEFAKNAEWRELDETNGVCKIWIHHIQIFLFLGQERNAAFTTAPRMIESGLKKKCKEEKRRWWNSTEVTQSSKNSWNGELTANYKMSGGFACFELFVWMYKVLLHVTLVLLDWKVSCTVPMWKGKDDPQESRKDECLTLSSVVGKYDTEFLIYRKVESP